MRAYKVEAGRATTEERNAERETVGYVRMKEEAKAKKVEYKAKHQAYEY